MSKSEKKVKNKLNYESQVKKVCSQGDIWSKLSILVMGISNLRRKQIVKGLSFLITEIFFLCYMVMTGVRSLTNMTTLGTNIQGWIYDEDLGIDVLSQGDNSMLILLYGVITIFLIIFFVLVWRANLKSALEAQNYEKKNKRAPGFQEDFKAYFNTKFNRTMLIFPMIGILAFTVLPLVYMILVAFTNYDNAHQPPGNLFTWVGVANFKTILGSGNIISQTFWPVLGWTIIWAIFATGLNYLGGILLALLINRKGIKFKSFWRTIFVMSIAIPSFVSLLVMRTMLQPYGAINVLLKQWGWIQTSIPFLTNATVAKITIIVVNLWIGIPYTMLITSGILMNIPADLYEAAKVDGANAKVIFRKIIMPYVLFVTTPYLITQFIGNINNFNVIYLLSGGGPSTLDFYQAGRTDLLVTWLYKLTVSSKDYCYASAIGIIVFLFSAMFSLITYRKTSAYNNEEAFQ